MTPEASRRHYLDAMGLTAWACRYVLPGAAPTEACEWEAPERTEPRQALHALLEEPGETAFADAPASASENGAPVGKAPPQSTPLKSARALLGDTPSVPRQGPDASTAAPEHSASAPAARPEPVAFTLTCACIDGRWLSVHPGEPGPAQQRLLVNMLNAAGIRAATPTFTTFDWPPMAGAFTSDDPLGEAREGVAAFVEGAARRQGWQLQRLLVWADAPQVQGDDTFARVLDLEGGQSRTLGLPAWQAPALGSLSSAPAKRALWPALLRLTQGDARS